MRNFAVYLGFVVGHVTPDDPIDMDNVDVVALVEIDDDTEAAASPNVSRASLSDSIGAEGVDWMVPEHPEHEGQLVMGRTTNMSRKKLIAGGLVLTATVAVATALITLFAAEHTVDRRAFDEGTGAGLHEGLQSVTPVSGAAASISNLDSCFQRERRFLPDDGSIKTSGQAKSIPGTKISYIDDDTYRRSSDNAGAVTVTRQESGVAPNAPAPGSVVEAPRVPLAEGTPLVPLVPVLDGAEGTPVASTDAPVYIAKISDNVYSLLNTDATVSNNYLAQRLTRAISVNRDQGGVDGCDVSYWFGPNLPGVEITITTGGRGFTAVVAGEPDSRVLMITNGAAGLAERIARTLRYG